jgi:hypothetical protein
VFNVTYFDTILGEGILGATSINCNWTPEFFSWLELGNGIYQLSFEAGITPANWSIELQIHRGNYSLSSTLLKINILIPFEVLPNGPGSIVNPITSYWTHSLDLSVGLYNSYLPSQNITGANVTYSFTYGGGTISETPILGIYNTTLSPRSILPGEYILTIYAEAQGVSPAYGDIYISILPTPSEIISSNTTSIQSFTENLTYLIYWNNTLDNEPVSPTSNIHLSLSQNGNTLHELSLDPIPGSPGYYSIILNTRNLNITPSTNPYTLRFNANYTGFVTPLSQSIDLVMNNIPTEITAALSRTDVELGRDHGVRLTVVYTNVLLNRSITGANLTATIDGRVYTLTGHANGTYTCNILIDPLALDAYLIIISAEKQFYVNQELSNLQLDVRELTVDIPLVGPVPLSTVVVGTGGFGFPVILFLGFIMFKRLTMPYPVKIINRALKKMQKGENVDIDDLKIATREETIRSLLIEDYETLNMENIDLDLIHEEEELDEIYEDEFESEQPIKIEEIIVHDRSSEYAKLLQEYDDPIGIDEVAKEKKKPPKVKKPVTTKAKARKAIKKSPATKAKARKATKKSPATKKTRTKK